MLYDYSCEGNHRRTRRLVSRRHVKLKDVRSLQFDVKCNVANPVACECLEAFAKYCSFRDVDHANRH